MKAINNHREVVRNAVVEIFTRKPDDHDASKVAIDARGGAHFSTLHLPASSRSANPKLAYIGERAIQGGILLDPVLFTRQGGNTRSRELSRYDLMSEIILTYP